VRRDGNPAAGASIVGGDAGAESKADGGFSIYNLTAGSRQLTAVSADGEAMGTSQVEVVADTAVSGGTINLDSATSPATATGVVVDDGTLDPVPGATVTLGTGSDETGPAGEFLLQTQSGAGRLTITAPGYESVGLNVTLAEGANDLGTFYLPPTTEAGRGVVSGTVRRGGNPAPGANIISGNARAASREDGTFSIYNLAAGSQAVTAVSADGLTTGFALVDVEAGSTTSGVTINLDLAPPGPPEL
jgi:hypothetical protein